MRLRRVKELMHTQVITAEPGESLLDAGGVMRLASLRHLPVVRGGMLLGMLSYRDLSEAGFQALRRDSSAELDAILRALTVDEVMRGDLSTIGPEGTLEDAVHRMLGLRIGCLPVVVASTRGPRLVGLLTEAELLRAAYVSSASLD